MEISANMEMMSTSKKDLNSLFKEQKDHFLSIVKHSSANDRIAKLKSIKKWIFAHQSDLYEVLYKDYRKPQVEADLTDLKPVLQEIDHTIHHLKSWMKDKKVSPNLLFLGTTAKVKYEPKGVCLILAPWNFPFMLTIGPLVSAIAAGNCCILKPSEMTPHTAILIERMITDLFNEKEIAVCNGDYKLAETLLRLPFNHIFFTGSPQIGKIVMKAAAEHLTSVTLELGGQNPVIIDETANIKDTAEKLIWGKFINNGQSCMAPNYINVHESQHYALINELKKQLAEKYSEDPKKMQSNPDFGRLVNLHHFKRVKASVDDTLSKGAELVSGGIMVENENYISPTILNNVSDDSAVMNQEIFGPVMAIRPYNKLEDVIKFINSKEIPLAIYIFSRSTFNQRKIINSTTAGTTCINDTTIAFAHPHLPFGGSNYSGIGKAHGEYGFIVFCNKRAILKQRIGITTFKLVYPPYKGFVKFVMKVVLKYL